MVLLLKPDQTMGQVVFEEAATNNAGDISPDTSNLCDSSEARPVGDSHEQLANTAQNSVPQHVSLSPPEDCILVSNDGGVLKKVLQAGESVHKPTMHARCLIHYVGYLASTGEVFMDTRGDRETEEPSVVVAGRTAAAMETGLCLAAATMSKGERALVYIQDPVYGYGALGSFSFPCVPPNSQLVYEVEMVHWEGVEETDNDRDRGSLLFEERLERAERRLDVGNQLYKEERYKEALAKYALALSYMDEDFMYQLEGHYLDKAEAVKLRIHLNMAAAQLKTRDFNTAIYNCGQVLNMDPQNVKALFRRGQARHALGRTEEAKQDLEMALKLEPAHKEIIKEMHALKATQKKERLAQEVLFKDRFKSSTSAEPGPGPSAQEPPPHPGYTSATGASAPKDRGGTAAAPAPLHASDSDSGGRQLTKRTGSGRVSGSGVQPSVGGGGGGVSGMQGGKQLPGRSEGVLASLLAALAALWSFIIAGLARATGMQKLPVASQGLKSR